MGVRFRFGKGPPSNKPPPPEPPPHPSRYPIQLQDNDGEPFWVSLPQPDMISLVGEVRHEHFNDSCKSISLEELAPSLTSWLSAAGASDPLVKIGKTGFIKKSGVYRSVVWLFGTEKPVAINFSFGSSPLQDVAHWFRIEFNPMKLGQEGIYDLVESLHEASGKTFRVGKFLKSSRVTRIDVAVDIIGLSVPEIILTAKAEGKRVHYHGSDGVLETVYVHKKSPKPKNEDAKPSRSRLGPQIVSVYDKRREIISSGGVPDFDGCAITRVEVRKTRFGNVKVQLVLLDKLKDPLLDIGVGQVRSASPDGGWQWLEYVEMRRGSGHDWACKLMNLSVKDGDQLQKTFKNHPKDVLTPAAVWPFWSQGLEVTGLRFLMDAAEAESASATF